MADRKRKNNREIKELDVKYGYFGTPNKTKNETILKVAEIIGTSLDQGMMPVKVCEILSLLCMDEALKSEFTRIAETMRTDGIEFPAAFAGIRVENESYFPEELNNCLLNGSLIGAIGQKIEVKPSGYVLESRSATPYLLKAFAEKFRADIIIEEARSFAEVLRSDTLN